MKRFNRLAALVSSIRTTGNGVRSRCFSTEKTKFETAYIEKYKDVLTFGPFPYKKRFDDTSVN